MTFIQELTRLNPELIEYDYNFLRVSKPYLDDQFPSALFIEKPRALFIEESYNLHPLATIILCDQTLSRNNAVIEYIKGEIHHFL